MAYVPVCASCQKYDDSLSVEDHYKEVPRPDLLQSIPREFHHLICLHGENLYNHDRYKKDPDLARIHRNYCFCGKYKPGGLFETCKHCGELKPSNFAHPNYPFCERLKVNPPCYDCIAELYKEPCECTWCQESMKDIYLSSAPRSRSRDVPPPENLRPKPKISTEDFLKEISDLL